MGPLSWLAHTPVLARLPLASTVGSIWSAVAVVAVATGLVASESTQPQAVPKAAVANARAPADRLARTPAPPRARMVRTGPEAAGLDAGVDGSPAAVEQPPADPAPAAPRRGGDPITGPPVPPVETMTVNDPPAFDGGPDQVVREDSGARTVAAWATGISPGPASESGQSTEFRVNSDAPTLFGQEPRVRPDGTLTFATAPDASGVATVTVRAVDNGGTENGGSDTSAPQTFAIAVTPANDPPAFAAGPDEHVLEDAGAQTVVGWATQVTGGPADEASQSVSFEVTNDEPGMFSAQPRVEPDGSLTYAAAADASGTATVTVRAVDSGGTADGGDATSRPRTFAITVVDVNDLPSFAAGPDQSVLEGAGAQTVAGWATATSPGPLYESGQAVSFSVGNDNPGLFSAPPQVQPNGTLTYTTAAGASGLATVTVQAVDNGGTAFGGGDTSRGPDVHDRRHRSQQCAELHGRPGPVRPRGRRSAHGPGLGDRYSAGPGGRPIGHVRREQRDPRPVQRAAAGSARRNADLHRGERQRVATVIGPRPRRRRHRARRERHQRAADAHDHRGRGERRARLQRRREPVRPDRQRPARRGRLGHGIWQVRERRPRRSASA